MEADVLLLLQENLSLDQPKPSPAQRRPVPRPENVPPGRQGDRREGPRRPHPNREPSKEGSGPRDPSKPLIDVFADPQSGPKSRSHRSRPRRNSDSSLMERPAKPLDPEEEKRRRERRHREREARHKDGKPRSKRGPSYRLDVIDKLDVTSIYGAGCKFANLYSQPKLHVMGVIKC
jgi:hypothetical protein